MFKHLQKQFIDNGQVHCPRRGHDVECDVCAGCEYRAELREDARPPFVVCEVEPIRLYPSAWRSGW